MVLTTQVGHRYQNQGMKGGGCGDGVFLVLVVVLYVLNFILLEARCSSACIIPISITFNINVHTIQ